jgi:hypothetical protein
MQTKLTSICWYTIYSAHKKARPPPTPSELMLHKNWIILVVEWYLWASRMKKANEEEEEVGKPLHWAFELWGNISTASLLFPDFNSQIWNLYVLWKSMEINFLFLSSRLAAFHVNLGHIVLCDKAISLIVSFLRLASLIRKPARCHFWNSFSAFRYFQVKRGME